MKNYVVKLYDRVIEMSREKYLHALLTETARYAMLTQKGWDLNNKKHVEHFAVWYLLNPLRLAGRDKLRHEIRTADDKKRHVLISAHAHHHEPLEASPDDALVYHVIASSGRESYHYICDRFRIRRIE